MEKNCTCFVNAYFDTKKKTMENPAKEKQKKSNVLSGCIFFRFINIFSLHFKLSKTRKKSVKEFHIRKKLQNRKIILKKMRGKGKNRVI